MKNITAIPMTRTLPMPPKVRGLPLGGALLQLAQDPFKFFQEARVTYGDIYTLDLGMVQVVMLNHPQHAQHTLIDHAANYTKGGAMWDSIRTLLGNGLPVSEGNFWRRQRRMIQPNFHRTKLAALTDLMVEAIDEGLADWDAKATGQPINIEMACSPITMKVITRTMFGTGLDEHEAQVVSEQFPFVLDYIFKGLITQALPRWLPVPGRRKYQQALADIDQVVLQVIARRRQEKSEATDLVTTLLQMVDDETGEGMTNQQLRDEAVSMFLAGYETTATAMSWGLELLTHHPEVLQKLRTEIDTQLGNRTPIFDDLPNLPYTRMVVMELLRLFPPAWWLTRTAVDDDVIDGYHIPAGTMVGDLFYMMHRHPDFWPEPERFDPERFSPAQSAHRHHCAWIPFGAGQRQCIGKDFALMEGQLLLARVLQRYDLAMVPGRAARPKATTVLKSQSGIWLSLKQRA